jgi:hypothetical protein
MVFFLFYINDVQREQVLLTLRMNKNYVRQWVTHVIQSNI